MQVAVNLDQKLDLACESLSFFWTKMIVGAMVTRRTTEVIDITCQDTELSFTLKLDDVVFLE